MYVDTTNLYHTGVTGLKGGLNTLAAGGSHDDRRFGQFALLVTF
jgi:hypothetical protein